MARVVAVLHVLAPREGLLFDTSSISQFARPIDLTAGDIGYHSKRYKTPLLATKLVAGEGVYSIQCLQFLGRESKRERNGVFFYMSHGTGFWDCDNISAP